MLAQGLLSPQAPAPAAAATMPTMPANGFGGSQYVGSQYASSEVGGLAPPAAPSSVETASTGSIVVAAAEFFGLLGRKLQVEEGRHRPAAKVHPAPPQPPYAPSNADTLNMMPPPI